MSGEKVVGQQFWIICLLSELDATEILARSPANLKRWRYQGLSPNWIELEKRHQLYVAVLLGYFVKNMRVSSVRAAMEETREAL